MAPVALNVHHTGPGIFHSFSTYGPVNEVWKTARQALVEKQVGFYT